MHDVCDTSCILPTNDTACNTHQGVWPQFQWSFISYIILIMWVWFPSATPESCAEFSALFSMYLPFPNLLDCTLSVLLSGSFLGSSVKHETAGLHQLYMFCLYQGGRLMHSSVTVIHPSMHVWLFRCTSASVRSIFYCQRLWLSWQVFMAGFLCRFLSLSLAVNPLSPGI